MMCRQGDLGVFLLMLKLGKRLFPVKSRLRCLDYSLRLVYWIINDENEIRGQGDV